MLVHARQVHEQIQQKPWPQMEEEWEIKMETKGQRMRKKMKGS